MASDILVLGGLGLAAYLLLSKKQDAAPSPDQGTGLPSGFSSGGGTGLPGTSNQGGQETSPSVNPDGPKGAGGKAPPAPMSPPPNPAMPKDYSMGNAGLIGGVVQYAAQSSFDAMMATSAANSRSGFGWNVGGVVAQATTQAARQSSGSRESDARAAGAAAYSKTGNQADYDSAYASYYRSH